MSDRVVLLGMCNPLSADPRHALYPRPGGSAGARVKRLCEDGAGRQLTDHEYLSAFERRNLLDAREWHRGLAQAAGPGALAELCGRGRTLVVFGVETWRALGFQTGGKYVLPLRLHDGTTVRLLPHPSGRCRWYNDPKNRTVAALLLAELGLSFVRPRPQGRGPRRGDQDGEDQDEGDRGRHGRVRG